MISVPIIYGKEEGSGCTPTTTTLKKCTACKMVKYCNRDCQVAHRARHKKECKKRAAEIYDETLFKDHFSRFHRRFAILQFENNEKKRGLAGGGPPVGRTFSLHTLHIIILYWKSRAAAA